MSLCYWMLWSNYNLVIPSDLVYIIVLLFITIISGFVFYHTADLFMFSMTLLSWYFSYKLCVKYILCAIKCYYYQLFASYIFSWFRRSSVVITYYTLFSYSQSFFSYFINIYYSMSFISCDTIVWPSAISRAVHSS
jgi:hypothetical protein